MEEQHFYSIKDFHLFEQIVEGLEATVEESYPHFEAVSRNPSVLPIGEVLRAISMFNEHPQIVEMNGNQYKFWRDSGISEEQEKQIVALEKREVIALARNTEILGFLNA